MIVVSQCHTGSYNFWLNTTGSLMTTLIAPLPMAPTAEEISVATDASRQLSAALASKRTLKRGKNGTRVTLQLTDMADGIPIPESAVELLQLILVEISKGNPVSVIPGSAELTTQQAADMLNVSRPYLIDLLEKEAIPHRKVGTHRRVRSEDVRNYKERIDAKRRRVLNELTALGQELEMDD